MDHDRAQAGRAACGRVRPRRLPLLVEGRQVGEVVGHKSGSGVRSQGSVIKPGDERCSANPGVLHESPALDPGIRASAPHPGLGYGFSATTFTMAMPALAMACII